MKCENCPACKSYFDGLENIPYCDIGVSEDEAYHDGDWYCNYNRKTIEKRLMEAGKSNDVWRSNAWLMQRTWVR